MNDLSPELKNLLEQYQGDTKALLQDNPSVDYLYALSDMRENLLEWFEFREDASLLEVGSDYGALTGLYGRRVKYVTVLDPNEKNLSVNRLRHKEMDHIDYKNGTLEEFEPEGEGFDYVVMIGSLEKPVTCQIEKAKSLLNSHGTLILAVCNRLGLKYQAGAVPDEIRLSKAEIKELLCGPEGKDGRADFYYPMPDYRIAMTMYSDRHLPQKGELTHEILAYDYPRYLRFDLGKQFDEICQGKQFDTFANSYLTIWSRHEEN